MGTNTINERLELVAANTLEPHPQNPRRGDVATTADSMRRNGFYGTIVAQVSTRRILAGNHRWRAALEVGMATLPVMWVDVDDEAALRILLADNRTSDLATYDDVTLAAVLAQLAATPDGLAGTGYMTTPDDQDEPTGPLEDPAPTVPDQALARWQVKPGDVWHAGDQVIVCGDATDAGTYAALEIEPGSVHAVWTDPPYGVSVVGGTEDSLTIENDNLDPVALADLLTVAFDHAEAATRKGGSWYVCCPGGDLHHVFLDDLHRRGMVRQTIVWVKDAFVLGRSDYHWRHEPILYGWRPGRAHYFAPDDRTQDTVWEIATPPEDTVWRFPRPKANREHPTMKPVDLVAKAVRNSSKRGQVVLDPFAGAGSLLLACHQLKRVGRAIELDPRYVAVTLDRLQALGVTPTRS